MVLWCRLFYNTLSNWFFITRLHNVNKFQKECRLSSGEAAVGFGGGAGVAVKRNVHVREVDQYGLSDLEYKVYLEDCKESVDHYADIHHFLTTNADVSNYLF